MIELENLSPSVIARETLRKLAALKIQPTPDNYHKFYDEIAGNPGKRMCANTTKILSEFATEFPRHTKELVGIAGLLEQAIQNHNWNEYKTALMKLVEFATESGVHQKKVAIKRGMGNEVSWADTIALIVKQLNNDQGKVTIARKHESLNRILAGFSNDTDQLQKKIRALVESWMMTAQDTTEIQIEAGSRGDDSQSEDLADSRIEHEQPASTQLSQRYAVANETASRLLVLLVETVEHIVTVQYDTELAREARNLTQKVHKIQNKQDMEQFVSCFNQFLVELEYHAKDNAALQRGLLRLLNKLMDSTGAILSEEEWIKSQIARLRETMSRPLDKHRITEAEGYIEEIAQRQGIIKYSLGEARTTLKKMVTCLISNIEELSDETGEYSKKIEWYSVQINQTDDLEALNQLLVEIMQETRRMQNSAQSYRGGFLAVHSEAETAQQKIIQLESELRQMNVKIHEDHLTGILNRRGLDYMFERETSRAVQQQLSLCFALLDIDNFKALNDTHGHQVGDEAIVYLVNAVKKATRNNDIVARYGGEEFVILLPDTRLEEAVEVLSRIRRDLTRKFFLHERKRILITFSAGVAEYLPGETQESVFKRADEALYQAKKNGKNLILEAVQPAINS